VPHLDDELGLFETRTGLLLGEPAISKSARPPPGCRTVRTEPDRNGSLDRERGDTCALYALVHSLKADGPFGGESPQQLDLLADSPTSIVEVLSERVVFDRVPTESDSEAKMTISQKVDLGRLLGDECGLTLGEDDDAGHELK
jgi:hypothetical protein